MKKLIFIAAVSILVAGCAVTPNSARVYNTRHAQGEQTVRMGVVELVRNVTIDKGASGVDTIAGGALGGIAAGSAIGGAAGNQVEANMANKPGLEITVRLDNGELRAITQDADELFRVGERVSLLSAGRTTRVTH